jgi:aminoglycoside phosphotransferase (APT) family kinase protein
VGSPEAEVAIDARLVRSLLADQHPDLADLELVALDAGWDNSLWRLGERLVVRLPRREVAVAPTLHEQRWLPMVADGLPLLVPTPVRTGVASPTFAWPWTIVPWIDGVPGDRATLADPDASAVRLGHFLRTLHRTAPSDAPHNPYRSVELTARAAAFEDRMATLAGEVDGDALRAVWEAACAAPPWDGPPVWLHGDLHPANTVVHEGVLAGVIDFGDICAGDPATDLAGAWMLLPASSRAAFLDAYGRAGGADIARARGWAVLFGLVLLDIGLADKPTYEPSACATLPRDGRDPVTRRTRRVRRPAARIGRAAGGRRRPPARFASFPGPRRYPDRSQATTGPSPLSLRKNGSAVRLRPQ